MKKIAIILGTRPEIIKMSPVIRECKLRKLDYFIIHSGQHYDYKLDKIFFDELELPQPKYNLKIGSGSQGLQLTRLINGLYDVLKKDKPDVILIQGDTNTVIASSIAATKLNIEIGHIESGLRSYEIMFEELNRILTGILGTNLFAPTESAKNNLLKEEIQSNKIHVTGNTIVDAIYQNKLIAEKKGTNNLKLENKNYFLVTCHRAENVDNKKRLKELLKSFELIASTYKIPVVFSMHPRTKKMIEKFKLVLSDNIKIIEPTGYLDFLKLMKNAKLILTDSGGIQEESCIIKVPCVTLRDATERPETISVGSNVLVGADSNKIIEGIKIMLSKNRDWINPYGNGTAAKKIIDIINS